MEGVKFSQLLTVDDMAAYLNKSRKAIYCMVSNGQLPYIKFGNSRRAPIRFDLEKVQAVIGDFSHEVLPPVEKREAVNG